MSFRESDKVGELAHIGTELRYLKNEHTEGRPPPFEQEEGQPSRGINAAGLAFTCALAVLREPSEEDMAAASTSFAELSYRLMQDCKNVQEALDVFLAAGAVTPGFSVLLADAWQNLAHVEVGPFGCTVLQRYSKEQPGIVIAVNCHQSPELAGFNKPDASLSYPTNNNGCRFQRGWQLAKEFKGRLDINAFATILADHENRQRDPGNNPLLPFWGYSICNHGTQTRDDYDLQQPPWGTVSAEIFQPALCCLHYCYGWPCGEGACHGDQFNQVHSWGRFQPFALPAPEAFASRSPKDRHVVECTTVEGHVTECGKAFIRQKLTFPDTDSLA
eukprot:TRINITY_DN7143_c0_g3_i6.p1 TRINITY_DN7143_c0_g3~~TRINITY_DN7143_c0_g3_i6.p1  ORF type:complete len:331 (-),score=50.51 TRINITY_DN7143_c0_g3_i6:224-1216(-)